MKNNENNNENNKECNNSKSSKNIIIIMEIKIIKSIKISIYINNEFI